MKNLENKEIFAKNLKYYMDKNNLDRNKLCEDLDLKYMTLSDWINAKTYPRIDKIELLADYFKINKSDLIEDKTTPPLPKEFIPLTKIKKIPILGYAPCGSFSWAEEDFQGYFVADELIKADYCLVAKGDSMIDADINDGDIVFMKHTQEVENGRIAVVRIDDTVTLKKVIKLSDKVILQPYNNEYEPIILQDEPKASIVGEMVGVYKVR
ncbi:helix-turn-helix domain-containing protein [Helcococcus ovis]|uniref:LexA family transcriptional regulator n=1 Tax=Helcococcus ovis TaxID=72026 RepID=UPI00106F4EE4|nr:S24 family peptidase [Helcococcus ovis]TFF68333.1 helix-turn-helix domain-containing protein [Helcococcus ovis]WNZ00916.1 S24 family peptidase [Helcococcus ovis]